MAVGLQWRGRRVQPGRDPGLHADQLRRRGHGGQRRPPFVVTLFHHQVDSLDAQAPGPGVGVEPGCGDATRCGPQADVAAGRVQRGRQHLLGHRMEARAGDPQSLQGGGIGRGLGLGHGSEPYDAALGAASGAVRVSRFVRNRAARPAGTAAMIKDDAEGMAMDAMDELRV